MKGPIPPADQDSPAPSGAAASGRDSQTEPQTEPGTETQTDAQRLRRSARGDRDAFEAVYTTHAPAVMAYLTPLCVDRGLAEDAVQEVFVRAWRYAPAYREERGSPRTWLLAIARRVAWRRARAWRRAWASGAPRGGAPGAEASRPDRGPSPLEALAQREAAGRVRAALEGLSERVRAAFVLVRCVGCGTAEAAAILRVPEGTVKSRVAAAQTLLRARFAQFDPTAGAGDRAPRAAADAKDGGR